MRGDCDDQAWDRRAGTVAAGAFSVRVARAGIPMVMRQCHYSLQGKDVKRTLPEWEEPPPLEKPRPNGTL